MQERGKTKAQLIGEVESLRQTIAQQQEALTKQAETARIFTTIAMESRFGVYVVQEGRFIFTNPTFRNDVGFTGNELSGMCSLDIVYPEDREKVRQNAVQMLKGQRPYGYEFRVIAKDGTIKWAYETVNSINYYGKPAALGTYMDITQRKLLEEALRESEAKWRSLVQTATDVILIADCNGVIQGLNRAITGRSPEEAIGTSIYGYIAPDHRETVQATIQKVCETGGPASYESRGGSLVGKKDRWYEGRVGPMKREGQVVGITVIVTDITERKLAEDALKLSEERWRSLALNAPEFIMTLDRDGIIQFINRVEPKFGVEVLVGMSVYDYIVPEDQDATRHCIETTFATGEMTTCESRGWIGDQLGFFVNRFSAVRQGGKIIATTYISTNVTELMKAQQVQRETEAKWRSLAENAPDVIMNLNRSGTIEFVNHPYGALDSEDIIGRSLFDFLLPEDHEVAREALERTFLAGKMSTFESRKRGIDDPQQSTWWVNRIGPVKEDDSVVAATMISTDVTRLKRVEQTLRDLSRRLVSAQEEERRHVARELHDQIGQELTGLKFLLDLDASTSAEDHRRKLLEAQSLISKLTRRVGDLSLDLRPSMLDDFGLVPALVWQLNRFGEQTGIRVVFHHEGLEERFPSGVELSAFRIVQEALTNIARYAHAEAVTVNLTAKLDSLLLRISDNGIGFDAKGALASGLSVGLLGMRERANAVGGQFNITSYLGLGTDVNVELPVHGSSGDSRIQRGRTK